MGTLLGTVKLGAIIKRMDPATVLRSSTTADSFSDSQWPMVRLGDVATRMQYGMQALASTAEAGLPMIRMNNIQDGSLDLTDLKYVEPTASEAENYLLELGDLLITRTNGSRDLVGKTAVFTETGSWVFASYLIRVQVDQLRVLPEFLAAFLNVPLGRQQITDASRQILMSNINLEELRNVQLPLPPLQVQRQLTDTLHRAAERMHAARNRVRLLGRELGAIAAGEISTVMDVTPPSTYTVRLGDLLGGRLDPSSHQLASPSAAVAHADVRTLIELGSIQPRTTVAAESSYSDDQLVPYAGLPDCDFTRVRTIIERRYGDVKGRPRFRKGDILFARIEPSIFNQKFVYADKADLSDVTYTSTEFYIIRPHDSVDPFFLFGALFTNYVAEQVRGRTTGTSGRRRITRSLFETLRVPVPPLAQQRQVGLRIVNARAEALLDVQIASRRHEEAIAVFSGSLTTRERTA